MNPFADTNIVFFLARRIPIRLVFALTLALLAGAADGAPAPAMPGVNVEAIKVDTVGWPLGWEKVAVCNVEPVDACVVDASDKVVWRFPAVALRDRGVDAASGDRCWQADFSRFVTPGVYRIRAGTKPVYSAPFTLSDHPYAVVLKAALKHFYFQRCRTELKEPFAAWEGQAWTRARACHVHEGIAWDESAYPEKKTRFTPEAGWHDAGNFEIYTATVGPVCWSLFTAFDRHPHLFSDGQLNIPESGNGIPDILDEAIWGLRWLFSLQAPDGGQHAREIVIRWPPEGPADADLTDRWISPVATAATAKACQAFALGARVLEPYDKTLAERCAQAARKAWRFLETHPARLTIKNPAGTQPLWDDGADGKSEAGQRLAAAAEMGRTFRDRAAWDAARALLKDDACQPRQFAIAAWTNIARWGLMTLAADRAAPKDLRAEAKVRLLEAADGFKQQWRDDGHRCATLPADYFWGHNSNLMEKAELLVIAYRLDPKGHAWALQAARDQWHWVLGRNANGFSMVTQIGKSPTRMYHGEWGRAATMPPGYLVGGPNSHDCGFLAPGAPAKALLWDNPRPLSDGTPAHALWHNGQQALWEGGFLPPNDWRTGWYAVNEPDIYYNSNLVLVAAEMQE